jgi:hypothetical protein
MKTHLNEIDPLPFLSNGYIGRATGHVYVLLPESRRQEQEDQDWLKKHKGEDWRPYSPGVEINGKGQMRTKDYKPPEPPETDIPIPCVVDSFDQMLGHMFKTMDALYPAESQPQAASQMEQGLEWLWKTPYGTELRADSEGWFSHTPGDPMPCDPNMLVYVRFDDGGGSGEAQQASFWAEGPEDNWRGRWDTGEPLESDQITAWRPA